MASTAPHDNDAETSPFAETFETEADSRGRLSLGKAGAKPGRRYRVEYAPDGTMTLTPVVSIPERELPVWTDPDLKASLRDSLEALDRGERGVDRGDFTQYLDSDEDDEEKPRITFHHSAGTVRGKQGAS
ncbi:hypothetical protein [Streptomyces sp. NPDC096033]|uniref:hypothetical protein n=1 Tax=Streptomyces sp. NPDC096033 TaxID=3366071 RepID=UPI00380A7554